MTLTKREQDKLILEHYGYIRSCAVIFWKRNQKLDRDDVIAQAFLAACEAAAQFDREKGIFSSFVKLVVGRELWNFRRDTRQRFEFQAGEFDDPVDEASEIETAIDARRFIEKAKDSPLLSRRLMGHTLHQIGTEEGVNKSTVKRREDQELKALQPFMPECATRTGRLGNLQTTTDSERASVCQFSMPKNSSPPPDIIAAHSTAK